MNAADHTFRSALRQHRLAPSDAGFPRRLKDFADACESQQIACEYAAQEGLGWEPLPPARRLPPPELRPDSGRRGPAELWAKFDPAWDDLGRALEGISLPPWRVLLASWPRSRVTYPPRSPKKTDRSCLACSTAEPIAEDPLDRQPTFGIVARTAAASSRNSPARLRLRYDESPSLFDGAAWSSQGPRSWPPTEQAPQHNIPPAADNESQPSTPNTPPGFSTSLPANSAPRHTYSRPSAKPLGQSSQRRTRYPLIPPDRHGLVRFSRSPKRTQRGH